VVIFHAAQAAVGLSPKLSEVIGTPLAIFNFAAQTIFDGHFAVIVFFILSGYVMGANLVPNEDIRPRGYCRFLVRRVFRLVPMLVVSIGFAIALRMVLAHEHFDWRQIIAFLSLSDVSINGPLWSLRVELIASAIYLPLLFVGRSFGMAGALVLTIPWTIYSTFVGRPSWFNPIFCASPSGLLCQISAAR
jgi:peptidoglycan/LPS O-acetylase OafA/YrhL